MSLCKHFSVLGTQTRRHVDATGPDRASSAQERKLKATFSTHRTEAWSLFTAEDEMGSGISKRAGLPAPCRLSHGFLSNMGVSKAQRLGHLAVFSRPVEVDDRLPVPRPILPPGDTERTPPPFISVFLPEFPHHKFPGEDHWQVLGFIAKGSCGPIIKVKNVLSEKTYAVKILTKSEILKNRMLEQSKEEVIIQRQLKHPFIHNLQDCWQTQRNLFIMCDYCSIGDLYTCWLLRGRFEEDEVRLFAAELGSALGFLHDLGIIHRDIKMENILLSDQGHLRLSDFGLSRRLKRGGRAFTICGTIQYMAPEVLSGGPYNHAADWWSLGIMLFSLVTGEFPVPAEPDHSTMLSKVRTFHYVLPSTFSSSLLLLLTELLCKNPVNRLRNLECFKMQAFFRGASFDSHILQKTPVKFILELRTHPDWTAKAMRGLSLDYFDNFNWEKILNSPPTPSELPSLLANMDLS
ncbi:ribosomal protein S6 kinase-related protein-like [Echeneis naucrates]|uniref:ribosomal protein S6 kinase-related protein-like n=1 Tax=Echeneis naucrates TaxID=173247 RepID=UPI0011137AA6|nr:ribosomal protein S6 kinase-related protein-like [Echeneis naucrates]